GQAAAAEPLLDRRQALVDLGLAGPEDHVDVGAAHDLRRVASDVLAVLLEHLVLVADDVGPAEEVGVVGVLGGDAQGLLLPTAGDPHRYAVRGRPGQARPLQGPRVAQGPLDLVVLAGEGGRAGGPHLPEDLDALAEPGQAAPG